MHMQTFFLILSMLHVSIQLFVLLFLAFESEAVPLKFLLQVLLRSSYFGTMVAYHFLFHIP